jgi:hypothetical protein
VPDLLAHLPRGPLLLRPDRPWIFARRTLSLCLEAFVLRTLPTPPKSIDLPRETIAESVSLFDLRQHHCRWPVTGVGAAMQFCGADIHGDRPYCVRHSRRAYSSLASRAAEKQRWLQRNLHTGKRQALDRLVTNGFLEPAAHAVTKY